jgi:hypothetical protein
MASAASPAVFNCAITLVIAVAFSVCASRGLRARDSAVMVIQARSGTTLAIASPVVTITDVSSDAGAAVCASRLAVVNARKVRIRMAVRNTMSSAAGA